MLYISIYCLALLKDSIFYFFYGIIIKIIKFFVIIAMYHIDFQIKDIAFQVKDYEVHYFSYGLVL